MVDEFTKIFPSALGPFINHHQGLLACIKSLDFFKMSFESYILHGDVCDPGFHVFISDE